jgi:hypothetical protein
LIWQGFKVGLFLFILLFVEMNALFTKSFVKKVFWGKIAE